MSSYEDMRDFQMREQYGDDYITPTRAYTSDDLAEMEHDHGPDYMDILNDVMERDMARYNRERDQKIARQAEYIKQLEARIEELEG